ncbi:phosphoribosyltransferase [Pseudomonas subflava]|uniref:phosphoribosyltransferase n=1 Tax=Pseudomonas subflava TaxID=2952933 RepID=UPI00207A13C7|nr:phosphoribosyltransferase [Pseudomonas subflava]
MDAFRDRRHAGQALVKQLRDLPLKRPVVLALPRGGVPVGHEVARALNAPLDVLLVRKIGAPGNEEFALGAVVGGAEPQWVMDEDMMRLFDPPPGWFERKVAEQLDEIERRRALYCGARLPTVLLGRDLLLVDDGLATGSTARVAIQALRSGGAGRIVLAVPVGPLETVQRLRPLVDELVCLETPDPFRAVGNHYRDFRQVSDQEVVELLAPRARG